MDHVIRWIRKFILGKRRRMTSRLSTILLHLGCVSFLQGTSYTVLNTEFVSGCTTASNYAANYDPLVPVRPEYVNGPYLRSPDKPLPPRYILTKTHCGGYCMDCPPTAYLLDPEPFQQSCLLSQRSYNATAFYSVLYSPDIPKRAVHLIRNPFDNLVGRMHLFDTGCVIPIDHNSIPQRRAWRNGVNTSITNTTRSIFGVAKSNPTSTFPVTLNGLDTCNGIIGRGRSHKIYPYRYITSITMIMPVPIIPRHSRTCWNS